MASWLVLVSSPKHMRKSTKHSKFWGKHVLKNQPATEIGYRVWRIMVAIHVDGTSAVDENAVTTNHWVRLLRPSTCSRNLTIQWCGDEGSIVDGPNQLTKSFIELLESTIGEMLLTQVLEQLGIKNTYA